MCSVPALVFAAGAARGDGSLLEPPPGRVVHGMGQWQQGDAKLLPALPTEVRPASELLFITLGDRNCWSAWRRCPFDQVHEGGHRPVRTGLEPPASPLGPDQGSGAVLTRSR
jgi:hypothetical protein